MEQKPGSPDRFGYSWDRFHELTKNQENQFRLWTSLIDPETGWKDRTILDVGCGAGRNSYWAMTYGASGGLAIDLDERSLERARHNLESFPGMEVRKASIYDLESSEEVDIAFSIGVIHHLEEPDKALSRMVRATKPGGTPATAHTTPEASSSRIARIGSRANYGANVFVLARPHAKRSARVMSRA